MLILNAADNDNKDCVLISYSMIYDLCIGKTRSTRILQWDKQPERMT